MLKKIIFSFLEIHDFYNQNVIKSLETPLFDQIKNTTTGKPLKNLISNDKKQDGKTKIYYVTYIPLFTEINLNIRFKKLAFNRFKGFLINLENFNTIDDYMSKQFGAKSRSKIRSYINRLETCFDISYKTYFGDIDEKVYKNLFTELERMIKRRFDQRGEQHQAMEDWNYYKETTFKNILNKNASLFVIYDNNKPIDICINYHYENIIINSIRAFDIDYSKFKLGYIDIYKQVEWSFENNINIFDLGPGILTYKEQWCNVVYKFKNYLIYDKNSATSTILSLLLFLFYKLKIFLDSKNIIVDKDNTKKDSNAINNQGILEQNDYIEIEEINNQINTELKKDYNKINFELEEFSFLRNVIYDYLYLNFDKKTQVNLYQSNNNPSEFILSGKKIMKLTLKN